MPFWRSLSNPITGFTFAEASDFRSEGAWSWIVDTIIRNFECEEDDVGSVEDHDGREFITVKGERVAELTYRVAPDRIPAAAEPRRLRLVA